MNSRGPLYYGVTALVWAILLILVFFVALAVFTAMLG